MGILFLALGLSTWRVHQSMLVDYAWPLAASFVSQLTLFATSLIEFNRTPCCHGYSAKLWGLALLVAVVALFGFGFEPLMWAPIICCIINAIDEIVITLILPVWHHDVKSIPHALQLRNALSATDRGILYCDT